METSSFPAFWSAHKSYLTRLALGIVFLFVGSQGFKWQKNFLLEYHGPWGMRLGVLLLPWLLVLLYLRVHRRIWRPDELEVIISREALAFAFYGMLLGVAVIGQLQLAGFIPVFAWTNIRLVLIMAGLLLVGMGWSKLRYR